MNNYKKIRGLIEAADAILIGASNGLSMAEGYNIFADDRWFQENMGDFKRKYGLQCILHGFTVQLPVEEKWAFVSRVIKAKSIQDEPSKLMKDMYKLVKGKEYFVVTSNGEDHFIPAGFKSECVFEMEGKLTEMRCVNGCHDKVYSDKEAILAMAQGEIKGRVPQELLPKCPKCGCDMEVNYGEMSSFTNKKGWQDKATHYKEFLERFKDKKLVILEFGVGWRNQMIKAPFMQLTVAESQAKYITFNKGEIFIPEKIQRKSIGVDEDIAIALKKILEN